MRSRLSRSGRLLCIGATPGVGDDLRHQTAAALEAVLEAVDEAGGGPDDLVDVMSFHADVRDIDESFDVARRRLGPGYPAWTPVAPSATPEGARVAIKAIADLSGSERRGMVPESIRWWTRLPASAGCVKGGLLWIAGQYGSDADGRVNTPGDHAGQARNAFNRIAEICRLAGGGLDDVIGVTSFHHDPRGIEPALAVYRDEFSPARGASAPWSPAGAASVYRFGMLGQYRALAKLGSGGRPPSSAADATAHAGSPDGGGRVVVAAAGPGGDRGEMTDGRGDPRRQAGLSIERLERELNSQEAALEDLVDLICMHKDPRCTGAVADELGTRLSPDHGPAWTSVGVTGLRHPDHLVALHGIAVVGAR